MKTKEKLTEKERLYEELRQVLSGKPEIMPNGPATMKLIKFLYRTKDEVEVAKSMERMAWKSAAEIAAESGKDIKQVERILQRLYKRGSVQSRERQGEPSVKEYKLASANHTIIPRGDPEAQEFKKLINQYMDEIGGIEALGFYDYTRSRVMLVDNTAAAGEKVEPWESPSELIKAQYKEGKKVGIAPCACRVEWQNADCHAPTNTCYLFGPTADSFANAINQSGGVPLVYVTEDEALKHLDELYKAGQVPHTTNFTSLTQNGILCMCCTDCCRVFRYYVKKPMKATYHGRTNFEPKTDGEKCNLCNKCVEICPTKARWHHWPHKEDLSDNFIFLENDRCFGCGLCAYHCPQDAIGMVRVREFVPEPDFATSNKKLYEEARH